MERATRPIVRPTLTIEDPPPIDHIEIDWWWVAERAKQMEGVWLKLTVPGYNWQTPNGGSSNVAALRRYNIRCINRVGNLYVRYSKGNDDGMAP